MSREEELIEIAAELANEPFAQADALRELADALDRGEPLPLEIAKPLIARMARRERSRRHVERVCDGLHDILSALAKDD